MTKMLTKYYNSDVGKVMSLGLGAKLFPKDKKKEQPKPPERAPTKPVDDEDEKKKRPNQGGSANRHILTTPLGLQAPAMTLKKKLGAN